MPATTTASETTSTTDFPATAEDFWARLPDDPRLTNDMIRYLPAQSPDGHPVVLLGVVHDHPASIARVKHVLKTVTPATVGVELPPLTLPWYQLHAKDSLDAPSERLDNPNGGEMTTAVMYADSATLTAIDGPSVGFLWELVKTLHEERPSISVARRVIDTTVSACKEALQQRLKAVSNRYQFSLSTVSRDDQSEEYIIADGGEPPTPTEQAQHEQTHRHGVKLLLQSCTDTSSALHIRDTARESYMASRIAVLRERGAVVVVTGSDHIDALATALTPAE